MFYKLENDHYAIEETKNLSSEKGEYVIDDSTITRWFKNFVWITTASTIIQG